MIKVRRLDSGYWHVRGEGPCEWAQPRRWPCDEQTLRESAFPEASEAFIREALDLAEAAMDADAEAALDADDAPPPTPGETKP